VLDLIVSLVIMLAVVGGSVQWAVRAQRRRDTLEEGHARDHR
jgi:hypothetical protein